MTSRSWTRVLSGRCFCGTCSYTIDPTITIPTSSRSAITSRYNSFYSTSLDHCTDCRQATGALAVAWLTIPMEWLSWSSSTAAELKTYESSNDKVERTFCGKCGCSFTFFTHDEPETIDVLMGTLKQEDLMRLGEMGLDPMTRQTFWGSGVPAFKEALVRRGVVEQREGKEELGEVKLVQERE